MKCIAVTVSEGKEGECTSSCSAVRPDTAVLYDVYGREIRDGPAMGLQSSWRGRQAVRRTGSRTGRIMNVETQRATWIKPLLPHRL